MKIIKEELTGVPVHKLPSKEARLAPKMLEFILSMRELGFSLNATRIVLVLSANLYHKQSVFYGKEGKQQLDLFDQEWLDIDNDKDISAQLSFKISDFLPEGYKNYSVIKKGLEELQEKSFLIEFKKLDKNGKERKYKLKSALISTYILEEGYGFKLVINNFWYRALIDISDYFKKYEVAQIFKLNQNSLIFYFYLKNLGKIKDVDYDTYKPLVNEEIYSSKRFSGTIKDKADFLRMFNANYLYDSKIKEKLLDPMKVELANNSDIGFNYKIEGKNIKLICYDNNTRTIGSTKEISYSKSIIDEKKILSALQYNIVKRSLNRTHLSMMIEIYLKYSYPIVNSATARKSILRGKTGEMFWNTFKLLVEGYSKRKNLNLEELEYENNKQMRTNLRDKLEPKIKEIEEAEAKMNKGKEEY